MDALIVLHPVWWFGPPAILKGWVDQVLVDGVAIQQRAQGSPKPLLKGRRALLIQTYNATRSIDRLVMRGMSEYFWRRAVFLSVGILRVRRLAFYGVDSISERNLELMRRKVTAAIRKLLWCGRVSHFEGAAERGVLEQAVTHELGNLVLKENDVNLIRLVAEDMLPAGGGLGLTGGATG
jgi:hypothetical protein